LALEVDVVNVDQVSAMAATAVTAVGSVDVLLNNAGSAWPITGWDGDGLGGHHRHHLIPSSYMPRATSSS
jgi:NAD(P)-dependent dehydrogenase (short-subunit alcohol dehydrogenase family)